MKSYKDNIKTTYVSQTGNGHDGNYTKTAFLIDEKTGRRMKASYVARNGRESVDLFAFDFSSSKWNAVLTGEELGLWPASRFVSSDMHDKRSDLLFEKLASVYMTTLG